jgi:hypothetical protein
MSLVVSIPASTAAGDGAPVSAGDWFPTIAPADVRAVMRLGDTVTPDRLRAAIVAAIATVLVDLDDWLAEQTALGVAKLADVPAPQIDGESTKEHAWRRAVMSYAAADLAEVSADISSTNEGLHRAAEIALPVDQHRRNGLQAIRDIKGRRRSRVVSI